MSLRQLASEIDLPREQLKEALDRLDRNMYLVRRFEEREEWSSENFYEAYDAPAVEGEPATRIISRFIRAHGPVSPHIIAQATRLPAGDIAKAMHHLDVETISVGAGREEMYIFRDEVPRLSETPAADPRMRIVSLNDPGVQSLWASIAARYGDRWIYPLVADGKLVGGAEKWNMSGCIEVRELDLDDPSLLPAALDALDEFMRFHGMMGYELVRLREVLGSSPEALPEESVKVLEEHGYHRMGDMFVKGKMICERHPWEDVLGYVLHKQHIASSDRYPNIIEAVKAMGGLRSDAAAALRCRMRIPLNEDVRDGILGEGAGHPRTTSPTPLRNSPRCAAGPRAVRSPRTWPSS